MPIFPTPLDQSLLDQIQNWLPTIVPDSWDQVITPQERQGLGNMLSGLAHTGILGPGSVLLGPTSPSSVPPLVDPALLQMDWSSPRAILRKTLEDLGMSFPQGGPLSRPSPSPPLQVAGRNPLPGIPTGPNGSIY